MDIQYESGDFPPLEMVEKLLAEKPTTKTQTVARGEKSIVFEYVPDLEWDNETGWTNRKNTSD